MSRQPMLRRRLAGRLAIGLLGVATALLFAPAAAAQPEVEANDAITAAWQAGGGDTGPLGPKTGDVYPAGDGFAQNFASGTMFFTPATGARFMQGAILQKYESLGGPADSDLGFPTIDEGPGRAPGSRNSTFSASDNPVIFWTPATGARVVRGPINAAWDRLGGSSGVLGVPAEDETYDGAVVTQRFTGGELSYDSRAKTFTTVPPELAGQLGDLTIPDDPVASINAARRAAGGALGPLGAAEGEPYEIGSDGMGQDFVNGTIFYSPDTGANVVTGQVLAKYQSVGGPEGDLGFPITSEQDGGLAPASRISAFAAEDKPVIFWTPDHGAVIVRGAMNAAWDELGGATGELGAPVSDQTQNGDVITQRFSGGAISWDTVTQKFSTEPAGLAAQLAELEVPGAGPPQASSPTPQAAENTESSGLRWTWWWLLALVPLLLLGGLVGLAVLRKRRRRDEQFFGESESGPQHDQDDDGREDEVFGDRYAREGLGSLGAASSTGRDFGAEPPSFWGSPAVGDSAARDDEAPNVALGEQDDPDAVDTAPTRVVTVDPAPEATSAEDLSHDVVEGPDEADLDDSEVRDDSDSWDDRDGWDDSHDWDDRHDSDDRTDRDDRADRADWADWAHRDLDDADRAGLGDFAAADRDEAEFDRRPPAAPVLPPPAPPVHDAITDTGRHARIDIDEPTPLGTALHMPFDDPAEIPDGYPIKADTKSGLFWTPDSSDYDEAPVEIWFASEEIARTNGFVRGE